MYILDDPIRQFTSRIYSHRSAWARTQRCMLLDCGYDVQMSFGDLDLVSPDDTFIWSHGMEFIDSYNIAGGYQEQHSERLRKILTFKKILVMEKPLPLQMVVDLRKRASKTDFDLTDAEWSALEDLTRTSRWAKHVDILTPTKTRRVVLGDSHSIARYRSNTLILRNDGLTLHGLLNRDISTMLKDAGVTTPIDRLVIQAGNIDIRHHLMRQVDPRGSAEKLIEDLAAQLNRVLSAGLANAVEVTAPYPIEFEGRKIPKAGGYYKGTPFFGSWAERNDLRAFITDLMLETFHNVKMWPDEWFEMDPQEYAETCMEKPQSVHLSPAMYEWDLERNVARA